MGDIPSSNQGNSGHQSHRTWAGVRGFGSLAQPKSPRLPPPLLSIPEGRAVGGVVAGSGLQLLPHNCFNWGYSPPSCSPRETHAGSAHLAPRQLPSPYDLTHLPTAEVEECRPRPDTKTQGKSRGRSRKGSPQHLSPCWKSRQPCKGGRVGAEGSLLSLAGTALVQAWQSVTSPGTGTGP